jgi:hypothetical protein
MKGRTYKNTNNLVWGSEWAILQLYQGENKLILQWDDDEVSFVLDQHA